MMKHLRIIIIIIIFAVLAGFIGSAIRSYYLFLKEPVSSVFSAIPSNATVLIKTSSARQLLASVSKSSVLELFDSHEGAFSIICNWMDTLSIKDEKLKELFSDNDFIFAIVPGQHTESSLLLSASVGKSSVNYIHKQIRSVLHNKEFVITNEDKMIYRIDFAEKQLWYYVKQGLISCSNDRQTLLTSLSTLTNSSTLLQDESFAKLVSVAGKKVDGIMMINNKQLLNSFWPSDLNLTNDTPFSKWTTFDININKNELLLGGFTFNTDNHFMHGQQPVNIDQLINFPPNTSFILTLSLSDPKKYISHFMVSDTLHVQGFDASINSISGEVFTLNEHLEGWIGNSISMVALDDFYKGNKNSRLVSVAHKNEANARLLLQPYLQPLNDSVGILMYPSLTSDLWGSLFELPSPVYCKIGQDFVIFSPDYHLAASQRHISNKQSKRKYNKESFILNSDYLNKTSNISIYLKPNDIIKWLKVSQPDNRNDEWLKMIGKVDQIGLQYSAGENLQYTHAWLVPIISKEASFAQLAYKKDMVSTTSLPKNVKEEKSIEKEFSKSPSNSFTCIVKGDNKEKNQIAVFGEDNKIKMYDKTGKLLWSFKLKEQALGTIHEVDYYRNGKQYYLVPTKNFIHIIDSKGKENAGSPLKLPAPALGKISVFDYDNNKDYRILYVSTKYNIYNLTIKGIELPDWHKPAIKAEGEISFLRSNSKDYIIYRSSEGEIKIFDRRGRERVKVNKNLIASVNTDIFENRTNSKGIFMAATKEGNLVYINNSGVISTSSFGDIGANPWFTYLDFDADGSMDFIFTAGNKLSIFSRMKEPIIVEKLSKGNFSKPFIYNSSSKIKWIFSRNVNTGEVIGFNNKGKSFSTNSVLSDSDPVAFNPGGSMKEILVTAKGGKLILTPFD